ncbi:MAG TPA: MFS transporter [Candidatus Izemoplasmatales bacterium]|nr:MFS transporter [Candidatus Izemoplasmatales bacterium]
MENGKMKAKEKWIFAWGDFFGGGAQSLIGVLYLIFLTDIIGIEPALGAGIIMLAKLWDAVCDPLMGIISDNARTKMGRRRPFILSGAFLVLIGFALLWLPVGTGWESQFAKAAFALFSFLFYNTVDTIVQVPYSSLSAEISTDIRERNGVNVLRLVVSTVASAVCTLVPSMVLNAFKAGSIDLSAFYWIIGVGFGVFFIIPLILIGFFTKERAPIGEFKTEFSVKSFVKPLEVKAFRGLVGLYLCQSISMDILSTGIAYYALYVTKGSSTVYLGLFIGVQLLMFPIIHRLVNVVDKKKIYYFGLPLAVAAFIGVGLYPADWPLIGTYILTALTALGFAGAQLVSWIIFPDAVDAGELKHGTRATGSYSGIMTFIRKISSAVAIQIFGLMLSLSGYVKPTVEIPIPTQPDTAIFGIRLAMSGSFVLLMTLGYFLARRFVLTNRRSAQVREFLRKRSEEGDTALDPVSVAELENLKQEIF